MKFITAEEAKQFVPLKNDMKSDLDDAAYYTFTPSDKGEKWQDITYYLPRRKRMYEQSIKRSRIFRNIIK